MFTEFLVKCYCQFRYFLISVCVRVCVCVDRSNIDFISIYRYDRFMFLRIDFTFPTVMPAYNKELSYGRGEIG